MKTNLPLLVFTCLFVAASSSQGQTIIWGAAQGMTGDTDVLNTGTYFDAATFHSSNVAVNGVTFNSISGGTDGADIAITSPNGLFGSTFSTTPPSSPAYSQLNDTFGFGFTTSVNVTISNLTIGDAYRVESWSFWTGAGSETMTYTGTTPSVVSALTGEFVVGTFVATSNSETFSVVGPAHNLVDAVSVFDTTSAPEPSTIALFAAAIMGVSLQLVRKRYSMV